MDTKQNAAMKPDALSLLTRFVKYYENNLDPDMPKPLYEIFSAAQDFVMSEWRKNLIIYP